MRILVCGGRGFNDQRLLNNVLDEYLGKIKVLISGMAPGADTLAAIWSKNWRVPLEAYPADWARHGRAAGPIRNAQMVAEAKPDLVIAFPGGDGTDDMADRARRNVIPLRVVRADGSSEGP